jgi:hypothetical protein
MPTDAWARILKNQGRERYDQQAANYESHCAAWNKGLRAVNQPAVGFPSFPSFKEWTRDTVHGETLRRYIVAAWYGAKRDKERNVELQQVAVKGGIVSADHTHATVKNIYGAGGAGISAIFDVCDNTTGETATGVCVSSTAAGAYAHAASSLSHARGATINVCFTDNWPTSQEVLEALWGISHGRLDIFHWMRRLSAMLHDTHCDY